jgi:hypothetical protein
MGKHPGSRGIRQAREVAELADARAESPMESRLRMTIVGAGLPRHEVQEPVLDTDQTVPARPDLAYPAARLGIEYDGATHRVSLVEDNSGRTCFCAGLASFCSDTQP